MLSVAASAPGRPLCCLVIRPGSRPASALVVLATGATVRSSERTVATAPVRLSRLADDDHFLQFGGFLFQRDVDLGPAADFYLLRNIAQIGDLQHVLRRCRDPEAAVRSRGGAVGRPLHEYVGADNRVARRVGDLSCYGDRFGRPRGDMADRDVPVGDLVSQTGSPEQQVERFRERAIADVQADFAVPVDVVALVEKHQSGLPFDLSGGFRESSVLHGYRDRSVQHGLLGRCL